MLEQNVNDERKKAQPVELTEEEKQKIFLEDLRMELDEGPR